MKLTVCLDFDGVVHSYVSGWQGAAIIPDPPVDGTKEAIEKLRTIYEVKIYSSRSGQEGGRAAMVAWLAKHQIVVDEVCDHKPPAIIYVDDRAVKFDGDWDECAKAIANFSHWQKKV